MKNKNTISIRDNRGQAWVKIYNIQKHNCDVCGAKLWIAPSGEIYCNETHDPITYKNLEVKTK